MMYLCTLHLKQLQGKRRRKNKLNEKTKLTNVANE